MTPPSTGSLSKVTVPSTAARLLQPAATKTKNNKPKPQAVCLTRARGNMDSMPLGRENARAGQAPALAKRSGVLEVYSQRLVVVWYLQPRERVIEGVHDRVVGIGV